MDGEQRLRKEVEEARTGLRDPFWSQPLSWSEITELRQGIERDVFLVPLFGKPRLVDRAATVMVEAVTDHRPDLQHLFRTMTDKDLEDIYAFDLLLGELLPTYPIDQAAMYRINLIEGFVAWSACLVGFWTAQEPDATALWKKLPSALAAWRLMPPSLSPEDAEHNRHSLLHAMRSMGIDEFLADRVITVTSEQSTHPLNQEIRALARRIHATHLERLTALHRGAEYVLKLSPLAASTRGFFMTLISHVTYRGLLIGRQAGQIEQGDVFPRHMRP